MIALFSRIAALASRWPKTAALVLGLLSATGFEPLGLWPLTLLALGALMALVARTPRARAALGIGWAFGIGHFALGLNWIATAFTYQAKMPGWLGWLAVLLLSLYLAVYPALAAWGTWWITRSQNNPKRIPDRVTLSFHIAFAAMWVITEWLRSWLFTGFAWNPLGVVLPYGEHLSRWIGTYGLGAIVILISAAWWWVLAASPATRTPQAKLSIAASLVALFIANSFASHSAVQSWRGQPRITVVQPNVGQADKWVGAKADANFAKLARLTRAPADAPPRLILWPEAAIPDYLETGYPPVYYDRSPLAARARLTALMNPHDLMLLGALKLEMDKSGEVVGARNAVMAVGPDASLGPRYDKSHLVPYGEYLPMRPLLSRLGLSRLAPGDLDFWPGPGARTLNLGRFGKVGLQVCYEIIFSGQVVDRAHRPDFLFNPSNDAWFGAWGPPQHLAQARLRAIEEGLPVVRATPTGISAIIDSDGRILASIPQHKAGRIDMALPPARVPTLFALYGNRLPLFFAALLLFTAIAIGRYRR